MGFWADADGDSYGDPDTADSSCGALAGYVANPDDCDDTDADSQPGQVWYMDEDEDGYGDPGISVTVCLRPTGPWTLDDTDCDDSDPDAHPGARWYLDGDGDGYGDPGQNVDQCERPEDGPWVGNDDDCNDGDADVYPDQTWAPDSDLDGYGDEALPETSCGSPGAGYVWDATDCDDQEAAVHPLAEEGCDGVDSDCDGVVPAAEVDGDGDGFSPCEGDENDSDSSVFPVLYLFESVLTNLPQSDLVLWEQCFSSFYDSTVPLSEIEAACTRGRWLLGCRETGSTTLLVAAWALKTDVTTPTGQSDTVHNANGVGWYYDEDYSWGFARQGQAVDRAACDVSSSGYPEERLCWHTNGGHLIGGYRCGSSTGLNNSSSFERVIFHAD